MTAKRFLHAKNALPEYITLAEKLTEDIKNGSLTNWEPFASQVRTFFTPAMMAKVDSVVLGWAQMASYADEQTLIHVTAVLVSLFLLPEFRQSTPDQQEWMIWMVLFHDVAKVPQIGKHDYIHGFRSAAITGKALGKIGFPTSPDFVDRIENWFALTYNSIKIRDDLQENVQDNAQLPEIIAGIDALYGQNSPADWIIKGVLLHISLPIDPHYPVVAPLSDAEVRQYVDRAALPLLKMMMFVDTDAWGLFDTDPSNRQRQRNLTLTYFERLGD